MSVVYGSSFFPEWKRHPIVESRKQSPILWKSNLQGAVTDNAASACQSACASGSHGTHSQIHPVQVQRSLIRPMQSVIQHLLNLSRRKKEDTFFGLLAGNEGLRNFKLKLCRLVTVSPHVPFLFPLFLNAKLKPSSIKDHGVTLRLCSSDKQTPSEFPRYSPSCPSTSKPWYPTPNGVSQSGSAR